jgi:hypothetical protein
MTRVQSRPVAAPTSSAARPSWVCWPFRIVMTIATVMLFDQAVFAGQFIGGSYGSLQTHRENATYAGIAVVVAALSAILIRWPGRGPWWPMAAALGLFGLIALQIVLGFSRDLEIHIPLGVAIIILAVLLTIWAWRKPTWADAAVEHAARAGAER